MYVITQVSTSGLSILFYGIISLPDATSYDKNRYVLAMVCRCAFRIVHLFRL